MKSSLLTIGWKQNNVSFLLRFIGIIAFVLIGTLSITSPARAAAPIIMPTSPPAGQEGASYFHVFTTVDPPTGDPTWTWSGAIPPGLTLSSSTGVVSGVPTTAGTYPIFVEITDLDGSDTQGFSIIVNPRPFSITTTSLPNGMEATAYSAVLGATGGTLPYTWSLSSGSMPSGLSLNPTSGYITGTPARGSAGTTSFTITVTDNSASHRTAQQSFSIYIEKGSFQPTITVGAGLLAGSTKVKSNNVTVATLKAGETATFTLDLGATRTISVDSPITDPTNANIRYKADEDSQTISESQPNIVFNYFTEYKVDVVTSPTDIATLSGSGWYKKDDGITVNARPEISKDADTQYRFSYWLLPDNKQVASESLNYSVSSPGVITAFYDVYYKLTIKTTYGEVNGGGFYKAGTEATWSVLNDSVPVPGILGFFQGKYRATNPSSIEAMDGPKTATVFWEPDYTLPYILIPLSIALVLLAIFGLYFLLRKSQPKPAPYVVVPSPYTPQSFAPPTPPAAPRPIPQQHTTVVMIGDQTPQAEKKQLPPSTKEQLMEKFAQLLDTYESEIRSSPTGKEKPKLKGTAEKMLNAPEPGTTENILEAEVVKETISERCGAITRKLLRTVAAEWQQSESSTVNLPSESEEEKPSENIGLSVTWIRDIYHEWELTNCNLPVGHTGKHKGDTRVVYSLLNTITIKQTYNQDQPIVPPSPHFTDSMSEIDTDTVEIVTEDELPPQNP